MPITRRTFFASLAGLAVVPAVTPPPWSLGDAAMRRDIRNALDALHAQVTNAEAFMRRPFIELDQLSRYHEAMLAEMRAARGVKDPR